MEASASRSLVLAVAGHVEHVTLGRVPALPGPGDIAHLAGPVFVPGGGGGVTFFQLVNNAAGARVHLFTALGDDDAARDVEARIRAASPLVHAARREQAHTRDVVMVTPDGRRTIAVVGEQLHPRRDDPLPWDALAECDAVYFTAQDPEVIRAARAARVLVVTARRREALVRSGVRADVVVGSANDPREASSLDDYPVRPGALVMTEGARGGYVVTESGSARFEPPPSPGAIVCDYGAGDSFAGALVWYVARGLPVVEACARAGAHGAAVLRGMDPTTHQLTLPS